MGRIAEFFQGAIRRASAVPAPEGVLPAPGPTVRIVPRVRNAVDPATLPTGTPPTPFGTGSSGLRSNVTFMQLQSLQEMKPRDRQDSIKTSRFLDNRVGLFTALNENSVSGAIGEGIFGYSATGDQAFDDSADRFVDAILESPEFDITGEQNAYDLQQVAARAMIVDGDCGAAKILTRDAEGRVLRDPQVQLFTTDQIGNTGTEKSDEGWREGILRNEFGRALQYRILKEPIPGTYQRRKFDYQARDFMLVVDRRRIGLGRGVPWSHQGQDNGLAMLDLDALEKAAQYVNAFFAMWLESPNGDTPEALEQMITGSLAQLTTDQVTGGDTVTPTAKQVTQRFLNMFGGGAIPVFGPGQALKSFKADREGSIKSGYMTWLAQQVAIGYRMPPALVWIVAGGNTGPDNRVFLTQASSYFRYIQRLLISRFAKPVRDWLLLYGLLTGRINGGKVPANGKDYRTCRWVGPRDMTIDERYFHKTWAERIDAGLGTEEEYYALLGRDAGPQRRKRFQEIQDAQQLAEEFGVPYERYRRSMPGQNAGAASSNADPVEGAPAPAAAE